MNAQIVFCILRYLWPRAIIRVGHNRLKTAVCSYQEKTFCMLLRACAGISWLFVAAACVAQQPVAIGRGSYASVPPQGKVVDAKRNVDLVAEVEARTLYLVKDDGRPIPSNKWYQNLLFQQYGTGLWALPHNVDATKEGIELYYATRASGDGTQLMADFPLVVTGRDFQPTDSRLKDWSDWLVSFRMPQSDARYVDVTVGQGMPFVWCEFHDVAPRVYVGGNHGKGSRGAKPAEFFRLDGQPLALPFTGDALGVTYEGRHYALFAPDGTKFSGDGKQFDIDFAKQDTYLVLCPLPTAKDITTFHQYAFAIPRETKLSWKYDRAAGVLSTTWKITTEALKGNQREVLQGWLPHHWRENTSSIAFTNVEFKSIRGRLRCAAGNEFTLSYPFHGVLPNLPKPATSSLYVARMSNYLRDGFVNDKKGFATDTYWGGKDLQRFTQAAFVAKELADPSAAAITQRVRSELENWLTFTPGEKERFFAYYPRRKGLTGFNVAFGSQHFTDHHFHNGYFVFSAGVLSQLEPEFAKHYGDMARLVAKTYANYDPDDARFPRFRTFDIWRGHSYADGNGFPEGNNQESTGEAINSWVGMILLGEALRDEQLTAAGVMGYVFESRANVEYWFDPHDDIFPPEYAHNACGMVWSNRIVWGTWFTASPGWIYGIQWLPSGPYYAFYDRDRNFIERTFADAVRELDTFETKEAAKKPGSAKKAADIAALGGELGSYYLGFLMHANPQRVVDEIDKLYAQAEDKVAHDPWMANIYYQASALQELGRVDWTAHATSPTAMVYQHPQTKSRTLVAWNATAKPQTVEFFSSGKSLGKLEVPPHSIRQSSAR